MIDIPATERYAIAKALGLHEQYLYQCFSRRRAMPSDRCPWVESASGARVTVEQLRPDVTWVRVPDPNWPHPAGRPCIDVAAPVPQPAAEQQAA